MKLQSQLIAAFTALLIVIMAVVWYVIYSLILDLLIKDEQRQLEQTGELLVEILNEQYSISDMHQFYNVIDEQDLQMFMYDSRQNAVLFSTMPSEFVRGLYEKNDFSDQVQTIWDYENEKYVTSRILFLPETAGLELILLTPLDDIKEVQQNFFLRLFLIFIFGSMVAVIITYLLTKRLVTPLTRLKIQLKKIEKRKFDDLEYIEASGEIKEVADSVYEMADELRRYMNSQQVFFQNASHELKTPLMTIQGYAEGIKDGIFDEEETEKGLEVMVTEVNRLKAIINEMILLAKLDTEPTVYEPKIIKGRDLLNLIIDRTLPLVNEKGIALDTKAEDNITIYADEEKILRALLNVVINGIRHAKSIVTIQMFSEGNKHIIIIEDDGEGIPEELRPHIFHRFVKGKNGETGLGLAIARAIIEQSSGTISAGKSETGGARFIIQFPKRK
ncbi:sensor histidine kinase [Oceanobacillus piezotolerans]|uniref:histidine kinase n=1 Tax=Oceanobacillus piezotolerans TaxID=2448030 RepID=A0A498DF06_9BACI|nr:HAMP domain-containing sensor histidine kinase [Oceanobacillus piezotolerans]RLL42109.1 sensor histidine kinase [Oceanobacillus piezotolerans]